MKTLRMIGGIVTSLALVLAAGCATRTQTVGEKMLDASSGDTVAAGQGETSAKPLTAAATVPAVVVVPATKAAEPGTAAATKATPAANLVHVAPDADQAARLRNWTPVVSKYANCEVIAGPVYRINAPPPLSDRTVDVLVIEIYQIALSPIQMVAAPFWMIRTAPTVDVKYHGEQVGPTYTMDEALPYYKDERVRGTKRLKRD